MDQARGGDIFEAAADEAVFLFAHSSAIIIMRARWSSLYCYQCSRCLGTALAPANKRYGYSSYGYGNCIYIIREFPQLHLKR